MFTTNKFFYNNAESIHYTITKIPIFCHNDIHTVYLELINSRLEIVKTQIIKLNGLETNFQLPLMELDSGYYIIRIYTIDSQGDRPINSQSLLVGIDIANTDLRKTDRLIAFVHAESGKALLGMINRFSICLQNQKGMPVKEKLLIRNKVNQLIAICNTDEDGWGAIDIPILKNEIIKVSRVNGEILKTINTDNDVIVQNKGFALHAVCENGQVIADMIKAFGESKQKAIVKVFYKDVLLYEANGNFRDDTAIVSTSFSVEELDNKLLRLILTDEKGKIQAERLLFVSKDKHDLNASEVRSEILCKTTSPFAFSFKVNFLEKINNYLISSTFNLNKVFATQTSGFNLYFENKTLSNQAVDYSIVDTAGNILQIGTSFIDETGFITISECEFTGNSSIRFYVKGKEVHGFKQYWYPFSSRDNELLRRKLNSIVGIDEKIFLREYNDIQKQDSILPVRELGGVTVIGTIKSRISELEEKYVRNGMFSDINSISINVEDDPLAINYSLKSYLMKEVPGLLIQDNQLIFRMGYLDTYIDEMLYKQSSELLNMSMNDIGYIKFFKTPVNGGMAAERGGALLKGNSFASGLQGSIAIYTKKYSEKKNKNNGKSGLLITGYANAVR